MLNTIVFHDRVIVIVRECHSRVGLICVYIHMTYTNGYDYTFMTDTIVFNNSLVINYYN